ncbi:MAG TPA: hypothetical protein VG838_07095 [Opitutaceae bacterium]|nr:hypothetical protein [Lacunisphaera sp.]HWA09197.1 hypothetical protein [Opitutaceae bacterium]
MKIRSLIVALLAFLLPVVVSAQDISVQTLAALNAAISKGDINAVDAIVAANANNPQLSAQLALAVFQAAQAAKNSNPTLAGMLAAIAVASGGLTGNNAVTALNMVVSSPSTMALLTNPNAPAFTSNFFSNLSTPNRPLGVANSGIISAENSAQSNGSQN